MDPIKSVLGKIVPILLNDLDTDRIIPARFLRCVTFDGIGEYAFYDERYDADGKPTDFPMNAARHSGAKVILAGNNFGCGSSREHAPQSIKRAGFQAVIAESFAEIFFGNSLTIGLACVRMSKEDIEALNKKLAEHHDKEIKISLERMKAEFMGEEYDIFLPDTARQALVNGSYDLLAELLRNSEKTRAMAESLVY